MENLGIVTHKNYFEWLNFHLFYFGPVSSKVEIFQEKNVMLMPIFMVFALSIINR